MKGRRGLRAKARCGEGKWGRDGMKGASHIVIVSEDVSVAVQHVLASYLSLVPETLKR